MQTVHLFAGAGGGLLADLILGHNPIVAVEWDAYACAVLRERAADGWFPGLEVIEGDVREFDPAPYAGRVDCVCAGFPCQDVSRIGSGKGLDGERSGLYAEALRIVRQIRPRFVYLENVPDIVRDGCDRVTGDLSAMGYDARWCCLSSGNTGASMLGNRWWCLAETVRDGLEGELRGGQRHGQLSEAVAKADEAGLCGEPQVGIRRGVNDYWNDTDGCLRDPPWREDGEGWQGATDHGAPVPGVRRVADALAWRMVKARLACIGNGQDPLLAATAWKILGGP